VTVIIKLDKGKVDAHVIKGKKKIISKSKSRKSKAILKKWTSKEYLVSLKTSKPHS
jgi:hypothetical protein